MEGDAPRVRERTLHYTSYPGRRFADARGTGRADRRTATVRERLYGRPCHDRQGAAYPALEVRSLHAARLRVAAGPYRDRQRAAYATALHARSLHAARLRVAAGPYRDRQGAAYPALHAQSLHAARLRAASGPYRDRQRLTVFRIRLRQLQTCRHVGP
jgi:hypothetical protein